MAMEGGREEGRRKGTQERKKGNRWEINKGRTEGKGKLKKVERVPKTYH